MEQGESAAFSSPCMDSSKLQKSGMRSWGQHWSVQAFAAVEDDWALDLKDETTGVVWILLYVDDILILGYEAGVAAAAGALHDAYTVKEEDGSKYLGVNVEHTPDGDTYLRHAAVWAATARLMGP